MTVVCVDDHPIMLKGVSKNIRQLLPYASIGGNVATQVMTKKENKRRCL